MKKTGLILILALLAGNRIKSQSAYVSAGAGYLPNQEKQLVDFHFFQSPFNDFQEMNWKHGYQFYAEFGKEVPLFEHGSLLGAWQVRHQVNPVLEKFWSQEKSPSGDLHFESTSNSSFQVTAMQVSLSLNREFEIGNHNLDIFAGGYASFLLESWSKAEGNGLQYYTDVVEGEIFDSLCQCYQSVIISKTKLDPPETYTFKREYQARNDRNVQFGIHGGILFPLLSTDEGFLKGRFSISYDFHPLYESYMTRSVSQTVLTAGLLFEPVSTTIISPGKPRKRALSSGIYWGGSLHTVFVSVDGCWLSGKKLGLDVAARYGLFGDPFPSSEIYAGALYQIANSRFFFKIGGVHTNLPDSEYYDESRTSMVLGGKYLLPFSRFLGMQVNAGWLMSKGNEPGIEVGIGLLFLPK